jgi:hypothetical protein
VKSEGNMKVVPEKEAKEKEKEKDTKGMLIH